MECVVTRTTRFSHLPSLTFLCIIPQSSIRRSSSGRFLELQSDPFYDIFQTLLSEKEAVFAAVRGLLRPSRRQQPETNVYIEEEGG